MKHSYDHINLSKQIIKIFTNDKAKNGLRHIIIEIDKLSYPFGGYNNEVIQHAKKLNYKQLLQLNLISLIKL